MYRSVRLTTWLSATAIVAASAMSAWAFQAQVAQPSEITAAEAEKLCTALGLTKPATLAAKLKAPAAGADPAAIRAFCLQLGFTPAVITVQEVVSTGTLIQGVGEERVSVEVSQREDLLNRGNPAAAPFVQGLSEVGLQGGSSTRDRGGAQDGVATINLRGMGAGRTMVLVNGVRLADDPTTQSATQNRQNLPSPFNDPSMNSNSIPMEVLSQVEVLKDGGGATYGAPPFGAYPGQISQAARIAAPAFVPPPSIYQNTEQYASVEPNPIKQVSAEPVSTFSIDVDTASYANVRRFINSGQRPPTDAVRVEEMINYFDYGYAQPASERDAFRPFVAVAPSPWSPGKQLVHIGIQGYRQMTAERPPLNLVFLVDTSGSMGSTDKLALAQRALDILVDQLAPTDKVSLVAYAGSAGVVLRPTTGDKQAVIRNAVRRLQSGGSTAGGAGLSLAYSLAEQNFDPDGVNRVILMTDGDFNVGVTNNKSLEDFVADKRETGIYLSVYGFGTGNYQDERMQVLAQNGNGTAAYVDTIDEARKLFKDDFSGSMVPIADDVKIQVEFNPARVAEYRLIGYETRMLRREDFNNDAVDAGEVGAGVAVTALYEITPVGGPTAMDPLRYQTPAPAAQDGGNELAFLKIRYKRPGEDVSNLIEQPIGTGSIYTSIDTAPEATRWAAAVAAYGQKLRDDPYVRNNFTWQNMLDLAQGARGEDEFGLRAEFVRLIRSASELTSRNAGL